MPDYPAQYAELIGPVTPEWVYLLPSSERNILFSSTYEEYARVSAIKDDDYLVYYNNTLAEYGPPTPK